MNNDENVPNQGIIQLVEELSPRLSKCFSNSSTRATSRNNGSHLVALAQAVDMYQLLNGYQYPQELLEPLKGAIQGAFGRMVENFPQIPQSVYEGDVWAERIFRHGKDSGLFSDEVIAKAREALNLPEKSYTPRPSQDNPGHGRFTTGREYNTPEK